MNRAELERLTPKEYLRQGYCDEFGRPFAELTGAFATAACVQLKAARTSPQELSGTFEAFRQALPWHKEDDPQERMRNAVGEALENAAAMYNQPNNPGIVTWLDGCLDAIRTPRDAEAFMAHFTSVLRQYAVIIAMGKP